MPTSVPVCRLKVLPKQKLIEAAVIAIDHNPANRPAEEMLQKRTGEVIPPQHIALLTTKYWGARGVKLGVSFLDTPDAATRKLIVQHMNAWGQWANVIFSESSAGEVRIARAADGYWSYLGTDIVSIPAGEATMNLQGFTASTPLSEYKRVVRHETGHTLGMPHEHTRREIVARIDPDKAIAYFAEADGWDAQTVHDQVLTPLEESSLLGTPPDVTSIMCYDLPASIMKDGIAVPGGMDIDPSDGGFAAKVYPKIDTPVKPPVGDLKAQIDKVFDDETAALNHLYAHWFAALVGRRDADLKAKVDAILTASHEGAVSLASFPTLEAHAAAGRLPLATVWAWVQKYGPGILALLEQIIAAGGTVPPVPK